VAGNSAASDDPHLSEAAIASEAHQGAHRSAISTPSARERKSIGGCGLALRLFWPMGPWWSQRKRPSKGSWWSRLPKGRMSSSWTNCRLPII